MPKKETSAARSVRYALLRATRTYFYLFGAFSATTIVADAWNLFERELTWQRWALTAALLSVNVVVWIIVRADSLSEKYYRLLVWVLVAESLALACFVTYYERGMSSRGVALFAIPIATSAILLSKVTIYGTAALASAAYLTCCTKYFYDYFNEGYKVELYTTIGFYVASFFVLAVLLRIVVKAKLDLATPVRSTARK